MVNKSEIRNIMDGIGVESGGILLVHSSLRKIGEVDGGADSLIDAMLEVLGANGTLMMPSFSYLAGALDLPYFDVKNTPGQTGMLTEVFRKRQGTVRSCSPSHSVLAHGKNAETIAKDHLKTESLGINSPIDKMARMNGFVMLLGVSQTSNSTIHVGEAHAGVKKFFYMPGDLPTVKVRLPDGNMITHVLDCSGSCSRAFNALELPLRQGGKIRDFSLGRATCYLMRASDVIASVVALLEEQPDILFCTQASCRRCVLGRDYVKNRVIEQK